MAKRILVAAMASLLVSPVFAAQTASSQKVTQQLRDLHSAVVKQIPSSHHITQIMIILNSRFGKITQKGSDYYLSLSKLQPYTEVYTTHPTQSLALLPTNFIFKVVWDGRGHDTLGHNKSFVHIKSLRTKSFGDKVRRFTLTEPKQLGKRSWQFLLKNYPTAKPPPVGDYELAHVFVTQCHIKEVNHVVRFLC